MFEVMTHEWMGTQNFTSIKYTFYQITYFLSNFPYFEENSESISPNVDHLIRPCLKSNLLELDLFAWKYELHVRNNEFFRCGCILARGKKRLIQITFHVSYVQDSFMSFMDSIVSTPRGIDFACLYRGAHTYTKHTQKISLSFFFSKNNHGSRWK